MKKRLDAGKGVALLVLRPSGKFKSVLGENCPHDSRSSDYRHDYRRVARPNLAKKPFSNPTGSVADVPDCLARLGIELDELPQSLKVYERLLNWAIV